MNLAQRGLILIAVLIVAALLAFPLRDAIYELVVIPAVICRLEPPIVLSFGFTGRLVVGNHFSCDRHACHEPWCHQSDSDKPEQSPSLPRARWEGLAIWMLRAEKGIYFKWLVANRRKALPIKCCSTGRAGARARSLRRCWETIGNCRAGGAAVPGSGLHRSFADFPNTGGRFATRQHTPLDLKVVEAVDFSKHR